MFISTRYFRPVVHPTVISLYALDYPKVRFSWARLSALARAAGEESADIMGGGEIRNASRQHKQTNCEYILYFNLYGDAHCHMALP